MNVEHQFLRRRHCGKGGFVPRQVLRSRAPHKQEALFLAPTARVGGVIKYPCVHLTTFATNPVLSMEHGWADVASHCQPWWLPVPSSRRLYACWSRLIGLHTYRASQWYAQGMTSLHKVTGPALSAAWHLDNIHICLAANEFVSYLRSLRDCAYY